MPFAELDAIVDEALAVARRFVAAGHRIYLVGGVVRDLYLDRPIADSPDIDLTTDARPAEIKSVVGPVAEALWTQGERFGTIGVKIAGRTMEITTFRSDVYRVDSRKPVVAFATAIETDLSRRDFTVNAMAIALPSQELVDPFGGARDLDERHLRTPLDPVESFGDDPLRMLRAARFAAGYQLRPSPELVAAMALLAGRLDIISRERVRDELDKLLALDDPRPGLALLAETGLLARACAPLVTSPYRAGVVALPPDPSVRLAALLSHLDADAADEAMAGLRHSNHRRAVGHRLRSGAQAIWCGEVVDDATLRRWADAVRPDERPAVLTIARHSPGADAAVVQWIEDRLAALRDDVDVSVLPLDGDEVMRLLGVPPGPEVGRALRHLRELAYRHGPLTRDEAVAAVVAYADGRRDGR